MSIFRRPLYRQKDFDALKHKRRTEFKKLRAKRSKTQILQGLEIKTTDIERRLTIQPQKDRLNQNQQDENSQFMDSPVKIEKEVIYKILNGDLRELAIENLKTKEKSKTTKQLKIDFEHRLNNLQEITLEILMKYYEVCNQLEIEITKNKVLEQKILGQEKNS